MTQDRIIKRLEDEYISTIFTYSRYGKPSFVDVVVGIGVAHRNWHEVATEVSVVGGKNRYWYELGEIRVDENDNAVFVDYGLVKKASAKNCN